MREVTFRAWDKVHQEMKDVAVINFVEETVLLWNVHGSARATVERRLDQVVLLQSTGFRDAQGRMIYGGHNLKNRPGRLAAIRRHKKRPPGVTLRRRHRLLAGVEKRAGDS